MVPNHSLYTPRRRWCMISHFTNFVTRYTNPMEFSRRTRSLERVLPKYLVRCRCTQIPSSGKDRGRSVVLLSAIDERPEMVLPSLGARRCSLHRCQTHWTPYRSSCGATAGFVRSATVVYSGSSIAFWELWSKNLLTLECL